MKKIICSFFLFSILFPSSILSQKCYKTNESLILGKINGKPSRTHFNINNISTWIYNNGDQDIRSTGHQGFEYPKGSDLYAIFESGLVWGGKIDNEIYVGGSTYEQGLLPGRIMEDGTAQDPNDPAARIFRVRPDYKNAALTNETEDEDLSYDEIYQQYEKDWNEWPTEFGAPFDDKDGNGIYNPSIDIPGIKDAHQTIWYVANDLDTGISRTLYGSDPMGIELQVTIWGYDIPGHLENVMFKKYKITNKSNKDFTEMYIAQWSDLDIGGAGDDLLGIDTLLSLKFGYNGDDYDNMSYINTGGEHINEVQYGLTPPSVGFQLLQGPIIGAPGETAFVDGNYIADHKNLDYTSLFFYICGGGMPWIDPDLGEYENGTLQMYMHMQGLTAYGEPIEIPEIIGSGTTKFPLSGNPITGDGWVDGILFPPCDIRGIASSGPFDLGPGESEEIVIAQIAAQGKDRLNSVALLKYYASQMQRDYPNILEDSVPDIRGIVPTVKRNDFSEYDIIELNIERADSIEEFSENGFEFQGYILYQMPDNTNFRLKGKRIFNYDLADETTAIQGETYDPQTGYLSTNIIYSGTNSGIPDRIIIDKDFFSDSDLIKGKSYYYGGSAYFYNRVIDRAIETEINTIKVVYQGDLEGPAYMDLVQSVHSVGTADVEITTEIVNPHELTGDTYEISFGKQNYYLNENGEWIKTNYPDSIGKSLKKPTDQTPSILVPLPSIYAEDQTLDVHFMVDIQSPDFNWAQGVRIIFPEGITVNSANYLYGNGAGQYVNGDIEGQTVTWGSDFRSANGIFAGGEDLSVNIEFIEPTFSVEYEIFDDGWSEFFLDATGDSSYFNLGNGTVDAYGFVTLTGEIGYKFKNVPYWNLFNISQNKFVLEEQTIFGNKDHFKSGRNSYVEYGYEPVVDGFRIKLNGSLEEPDGFSNIELVSPSGLSSISQRPAYYDSLIAISNYNAFGGYETSTAYEVYGVGTTNSKTLQKDYEIRFTGKFDNGTTINGQRVYEVIQGGQFATLFNMESENFISNHPLNPNPGVDSPFLIEIPFEVWNIEDPNNPYQVNIAFRDRDRLGDENPFWSWSFEDRMYTVIINSPYDSTQIIDILDGPNPQNTEATWVLVFWKTYYNDGDIVKIHYKNPISPSDVFTLTIPAAPTQKISPDKYEVFQNYPNPFNPNTRIRYFIPEDGLVNLTVYNILGQEVVTLVNKEIKAGKYETEFNGSNLASGVYIYRIEARKFIETKKMLLLK